MTIMWLPCPSSSSSTSTSTSRGVLHRTAALVGSSSKPRMNIKQAAYRCRSGGGGGSDGHKTSTATETHSCENKRAFLRELANLGRVRLVKNDGVTVIEQVVTFQDVFFTTSKQNVQYANLCDENKNVDFHIYLDKLAGIRFEERQGRRGPWRLYYIHLLGTREEPNTAGTVVVDDDDGNNNNTFVSCSLMLLWDDGKPKGEYEPKQIKAWETLANKWDDAYDATTSPPRTILFS